MRTKYLTSMRLTPEAKHLLALLAEKLGVSQAAVLDLAIREQTKRAHVAPEKPTRQRTHTAAAVD
jgi:hypothetical protein